MIFLRIPTLLSLQHHSHRWCLPLSTEPQVWFCQKNSKVITISLPRDAPMLHIQNCICFCCNSFSLQPSISQMCHSLDTATSDAFQPFMLSRFPSLTEHVSSKLPSPVNCFNSPIYTSEYLARVLLPCHFSLPSFLLPANYFLDLLNHLTLLIHSVFYFWTPSPFSERFLGLNI